MPQKHAAQKAPTNTENARGDPRSLTFMHPKVPQEAQAEKQNSTKLKKNTAPARESTPREANIKPLKKCMPTTEFKSESASQIFPKHRRNGF